MGEDELKKELRAYKGRRIFSVFLLWCMRISGALLGFMLLYFLYGLLSRYLTQFPVFSANQQAYIFGKLVIASRLLIISVVVFSSCILVRYFEDEGVALLLAILGLALYFGAPVVIWLIMSRQMAPSNRAIDFLVQKFSISGIYVLLLAFMRFVVYMIVKILRGMRDVVRKHVKAEVPGAAGSQVAPGRKIIKPKRGTFILDPCWWMPYCEPVVREICPAWEKKQNCWKMRRGCYCDEQLVERLIKGWKISSKQALWLEASRPTGKPKARCKECAIYAEHQRQKYNLASLLAFPLTGVLIWYGMPLFHWLYERFFLFLGEVGAKISFAMPSADEVSPWAKAFLTSSVEWIIMGCVGLLALAYVLKFIEYLIFEVQV